jgi:hypothetical protein
MPASSCAISPTGCRAGARATTRLSHVVRAVRALVTDRRIPRPLRWLIGLGLLPVPGPFDEIVLVLAAAVLGIFYRGPLREAWRSTA